MFLLNKEYKINNQVRIETIWFFEDNVIFISTAKNTAYFCKLSILMAC